MLRMRIAVAWALINHRQPHFRHQAPYSAAANHMTNALRMTGHLPTAVPRAIHEYPVNHGHQL